MFMKDDKNKKAATIIISRLKKNREQLSAAPESEGANVDDEMVMIADEVMQAITSKDPKALMESLKSFISMCEDYEEED